MPNAAPDHEQIGWLEITEAQARAIVNGEPDADQFVREFCRWMLLPLTEKYPGDPPVATERPTMTVERTPLSDEWRETIQRNIEIGKHGANAKERAVTGRLKARKRA